MNITINLNDSQINVKSNSEIVKSLNEKYPEVAMMTAMEECSELAIAISKCVRNGNDDKLDNLAEEIIDVLSVIQWAIDRFNISEESLQKWAEYKYARVNERGTKDEIIFRDPEAKKEYENSHIHNNGNAISVVRKDDSKYEIIGDTKHAYEYYHVLRTHIINSDAALKEQIKQIKEDLHKNYYTSEYILEENSMSNNKPELFDFDREDETDDIDTPEKFNKKTSKELSKILERANKKAKLVDKKKKGKKGKK